MLDPIWTTRGGTNLRISQMTTPHIQNAIAMIQRSRTGWRREYLERLQLELEIRNMKDRA